ncbi:MAG: hypothetical protein DI535_13565 [Citrobacter freundii]|nr:MAG: hypothetical protein DI535_13565 [Citrobacter freundii]
MPRRLLVFLLFIQFSTNLFAQRFGGTPPGVTWKQINTDTARIIYPAGLDSQAQRVAQLAHYQASKTPAALGDKIHKINIVLQNQTTFANGYVGLGPYRSEFYLTPGLNNFDLGSLSWTDQLSIHEFRHVEQFNNFRNGISNLMYRLFGEEGLALAVNASVPDWFFEGDAVYNETVLSKQGRGRLPLFLNAYPALWKADKHYSWMKLRNGSFKDYVPDHYNLGYLLVNYGYEKYGLDFWKKVTHDASAFKGLFYPFQKAIEKHAGVSYPTFREAAFEHYKKSLAAQPAGEAGTAPVLPLNKKVVTDYLYPYVISADSLLYLKKAYNKRPTFFIRDKNGAHYLRVRDISINDQYSYRNGRVAYAAYENDPRWRWRDYSVIKIFNIYTKQQKTITHKTKYFSPDISPDGDRVVAVYAGSDGRSELHILDIETGEKRSSISAADIGLFTDPKFISPDSVISAVRLKDGRMTLAISSISAGSTMRLISPSFNVIGFPWINNGTVYFSASFQGKDNVFCFNLDDRKVYKITNWPLGNYFANAKDGKLAWSSFTAEGLQLQQADESSLVKEAVTEMEVQTLKPAYDVAHAAEIPEVVPGELPARYFQSSKYKKGTRLFNFHSWRPYYEDPEFTFSLYGENVLNTLQTQVYYLYNENDRTSAVGASTTFGQLFPYLSIGSQYTFNRTAVLNNKEKKWGQLDSRVGVSIPLSWTSGKTNKQFNIGTNYFYRNDFNRGIYKDSFVQNNFGYLHHYLQWTQQVESAVQHIYPKLGYSLSGEYRHAVNKYDSWQFLGGGSLYLPGVLPSHSLVVTGAFQETDTLYALFGNRIAYARGYNEAYFARMWRTSFNYHFPLFYPDWGFANILYLKRIRANGFYDFMKVYSPDKTRTANQSSAGGEVYFDTRWWNQYELTFGFRVSHLLDRDFFTGRTGANVFEFIMPVSIFPR